MASTAITYQINSQSLTSAPSSVKWDNRSPVDYYINGNPCYQGGYAVVWTWDVCDNTQYSEIIGQYNANSPSVTVYFRGRDGVVDTFNAVMHEPTWGDSVEAQGLRRNFSVKFTEVEAA